MGGSTSSRGERRALRLGDELDVSWEDGGMEMESLLSLERSVTAKLRRAGLRGGGVSPASGANEGEGIVMPMHDSHIPGIDSMGCLHDLHVAMGVVVVRGEGAEMRFLWLDFWKLKSHLDGGDGMLLEQGVSGNESGP